MLPQFQGALWLVIAGGGLYFVYENIGLVVKAWQFFLGTTTAQPVKPSADSGEAIYQALRTLKPACKGKPEAEAAFKVLATETMEFGP